MRQTLVYGALIINRVTAGNDTINEKHYQGAAVSLPVMLFQPTLKVPHLLS